MFDGHDNDIAKISFIFIYFNFPAKVCNWNCRSHRPFPAGISHPADILLSVFLFSLRVKKKKNKFCIWLVESLTQYHN